MRILILNRRDIANPSGGGAEIYTHEISRGLVNNYKCEVVVFASSFPGCLPEEITDGVRYIRKGNEVTAHLWGFLYAFKNRRRFARIIDEFNGIGFFTFMLSNSMILIHQLYKEFWLRELGFIGVIPYIIEPMLLRFYRKKATITVSNSTKKDLEYIGFKNVDVVMNGIKRVPADVSLKKEDNPTLVFLGRLKITKGPGDAIEIFKKVKKDAPNIRLWMIGRGPDEETLKRAAEGLEGIKFWGWDSDDEKYSLLGRSHILLVPSVREGFGINVIEAASVGVPAIGYDVPGLRDSIRHGETGFLVGSPSEAAQMVVELLEDQKRYNEMSGRCLHYAKNFNWEERVDEFWTAIKESFHLDNNA
ncbi:MAG: glycosyltransferase family 4 protein [Nitrospirae bacterium]|nr:glycosyltransferase family 4 protein [Nitrospirota bacterium]